jgi:predicted DNA-binding transcriptional regulator AlpA
MAGTKRKNPPAPTAPAPEPAAPQEKPLLAGFLTQPQLIRELDITKRTFQRWEQQRCGPPRVTLGGGRTVLYARDSVLAWIRANESKVLRSRRA